MTNQEHLATLTAEQCTSRLWWLMFNHLDECADSRIKSMKQLGPMLTKWLETEYTSVKPAGVEKVKFCPCCYNHLEKDDTVCSNCFTDINWR